MRSFADLTFRPMKCFYKRFFAYLQDTLVNSLVSARSPTSFDVLESKSIQAGYKGILADLLTIILISVSLMLLGSLFKYIKDDDDDVEEENEDDVRNATVESNEDSSESKIVNHSGGAGDSPLVVSRLNNEIPTIDLTDDDTLYEFSQDCSELDRRADVSIRSSEPSTSLSSSMRESSFINHHHHNHHHNRTQRKIKGGRSTRHNQKQGRSEWLVRRTRSGQIYGKYPML